MCLALVLYVSCHVRNLLLSCTSFLCSIDYYDFPVVCTTPILPQFVTIVFSCSIFSCVEFALLDPDLSSNLLGSQLLSRLNLFGIYPIGGDESGRTLEK